MKNIVKDLEALREMIIDDCAISEDMLELEQKQWIARIDKIKLEAGTLFDNVDLGIVSSCNYYVPDKTTAMNCITCGQPQSNHNYNY